MHAVVISPACVMHTCSLNFFHLKSAAISIKRSSDHQNEQELLCINLHLDTDLNVA